MRKQMISCMLLAAALAAGLAGCDDASLRADRDKAAKPQREAFDRERLAIICQVAEQEYKVGDLDKCRESLKDALQVNTPYAPLHVLAAKVEIEGGNLEIAAAELKKAITIDSTQAETFYLLGVVYQRWQKFDTASDYYQQAADKKPGEALYVLAVAEMQITQGHLDQARQLLEDKMLYFEQSAAMRIALARIDQLQGNKADASRLYRDATMLLPEDKNLRWTYAISLYDIGKYGDAARILEELRQDPPIIPKAPKSLAQDDAPDAANASATADAEAAMDIKVSLLMTLGECYVSLKRPMDARDCFQEIIHNQPENVSAYLALGKTCLMTNDLATTQAVAQKALRFEPDNIDAMLLVAVVQQKQEKWTESAETLARASQVSPKDLTVLCMLGISQLQLGQKDAAVTSFEKAVAINPQDSWATELLGKVKPEALMKAVPALKPAAVPASDEDGAAPAATNTPASISPPAITNAQPAGAGQ